jgi:type IV pilus assembly protein PilA
MTEGPAKPIESWWRFKFTWTGLIVLAAIVGIVVAVAIPSYGDYTHRSQASEAIIFLGEAKTPLAEYFHEHKKWPDKLDKVSERTSGKYTRSVAISKGAGGIAEVELTATMKSEGVDRRVAGQTILMSSTDGGRTWTCGPGTMPAKNLPSSCRN